MADFSQDRTPVRGAWEDDDKARQERERRDAAVHDARRRRISEAAYHRAQRRGFTPGYEEQDWLEAEKEIDATGVDQHWSSDKYP